MVPPPVPQAARLGDPAEVVHALSRLLAAAAEPGASPATVEGILLQEARSFLDCASATLLRPSAGGMEEVGTDPSRAPDLRLRTLLLLPLGGVGKPGDILCLGAEQARDWTPEEVEIAVAFTQAAGASLAQMRLSEELASRAAQQSALTRAAKSLNESLDLPRVLTRICREAAAILDADLAAVWRGDESGGVKIEAAHGFPPEVIGYHLEPGEGLAGKVLLRGESMLLNDYARFAPPDSPFTGIECVLGVPMRWGGELHGVLAVGYRQGNVATEADLRLLETFAELAAVASRNASEHAGLAHAARTDSLTGCLNHAALHEALEREIERSRRTGEPLSLVLIDLDDFKQVNERHGHLVGDEVLRRVGHALQQTLRPYDHVARYGGDEFAVVAVNANEEESLEIAARAIERLPTALGDFAGDWSSVEGGACATAGAAEWGPTLGPTDLIAEADRALLFGKRSEAPLRTIPSSTLPESFQPVRFRRRGEAQPVPRDSTQADWTSASRVQLDRLRRRMRQLANANELGVRLAALTDPQEVLDATVDELHRIFGFELCAVVRARADGYVEAVAMRGPSVEPSMRYSQPRSAGIIGRCLRERATVVCGDVTTDADYVSSAQTASTTRSEACVPVHVGESLWGALNVETSTKDAFEDDDVRLLQTVADQLGAALSSAFSHERMARELAARADGTPPASAGR